MQTKLTLRLERDLIEAAKHYAEARGTSVSKLVADYFEAITRTGQEQLDDDWKAGLSPITRHLIGLARPVSEPGPDQRPREDVDEADYYRYLEEKHSRHLRTKLDREPAQRSNRKPDA